MVTVDEIDSLKDEVQKLSESQAKSDNKIIETMRYMVELSNLN